MNEVDKSINPIAKKLVEKASSILQSKNDDYGWDNFIQAAKVATVVTGKDIDPVDVAACLIGIKCARFGNLHESSSEPINESIEDTMKDLLNYMVLLWAFILTRRKCENE